MTVNMKVPNEKLQAKLHYLYPDTVFVLFKEK